MAMPALTQETINRISTANAPMPSQHPDPNVGKKARPLGGYYAALQGIIYPQHEGVRYAGEFGQSFIGENVATRPYLLMFFYDDGKFFCAIEVDLIDLIIEGGAQPVPDGDGSVANPFRCGMFFRGTGVRNDYTILPNFRGTVKIDYNFLGAPDTMDVYWINDETRKIASTNGEVSMGGQLSFYYDPAFNPNKIMIKINVGRSSSTGSEWFYEVNCPV